MRYKVCVLAAGVTRRIGDFSDHVNKAVLPVNAKGVISYIIEKFPEDIEIVIAVGHRKESIVDYLTLAYPERTFTFVEVEKYIGEGTGPGASLLECKDYLQCPFILAMADTIVTEEIPPPEKNWFGVAKVEETEPYATVKIENKNITHIDVKVTSDNKDAFIGFAGIHNYSEYFLALQENQEIISSEIQVLNGFLPFLGNLAAKEFTWFDTGTLEGFIKINKSLDSNFVKHTKVAEFTYIVNGKVLKFFSNEKKLSQQLTLDQRAFKRPVTVSGNFYAYDLNNDKPESHLPIYDEEVDSYDKPHRHDDFDHPLLCVGPMSKNIVDTVIAYSHQNKIPIYLIASRSQVETAALGGGYANNWTTEDFASYVREQLKKTPAEVLICRDHGGPWLGADERNLAEKHAILSAKTSFEADIASGFNMIHIDTSVNPNGGFDMDASLQRAFDLLLFCEEKAKQYGTTLHYEIGTEDADGGIVEPEQFEHFLKKICEFCKEKKIPKPRFIVGRTGTYVRETRQSGSFELENTKKIVTISKKYGVGIKEHNVDYDAPESLRLRKEAGIAAINVAPEFGVLETLQIIEHCESQGRTDIKEKFLELAYNSKKWKKWLEEPDQTTKEQKSIMSGHYVFGHPVFSEIRAELKNEYAPKVRQTIWDKLEWYYAHLKNA